MEIDMKLKGTKLKLAKGESLNLTRANEITELKVTLEDCDYKWYNVGFTNTKNFVEPIIYQS